MFSYPGEFLEGLNAPYSSFSDIGGMRCALELSRQAIEWAGVVEKVVIPRH